MLCIGLTLIFASASMASVADRVQHQQGITGDHDHLPFSKIIAEVSVHQHEPHTSALDDKGDAPHHQPGTGHHHHGDIGSGMLVPLSHGSPGIFLTASVGRPAADNRISGFLTHGLERPPKTAANRT